MPDDLFFPVGSTPNSAARFYKDYYPEFSFGNFERMLKLFELDGDAKIRGFSKGMQRQTEIALALASSPKVLLLDECLDGLDIAKRTSASSFSWTTWLRAAAPCSSRPTR